MINYFLKLTICPSNCPLFLSSVAATKKKAQPKQNYNWPQFEVNCTE